MLPWIRSPAWKEIEATIRYDMVDRGFVYDAYATDESGSTMPAWCRGRDFFIGLQQLCSPAAKEQNTRTPLSAHSRVNGQTSSCGPGLFSCNPVLTVA